MKLQKYLKKHQQQHQQLYRGENSCFRSTLLTASATDVEKLPRSLADASIVSFLAAVLRALSLLQLLSTLLLSRMPHRRTAGSLSRARKRRRASRIRRLLLRRLA